MKKEKLTISADEISVRDLPRRKFMMGAGGTVIAASVVLGAGCSSDSCDTDPNVIRFDADVNDTILRNVANVCDSD